MTIFFTYSKIGTVAFEISRQKSTFVSFILNVIFSVKIQCKFSLATLKLSLENGFNLVVAQATWLKVICIEGQQQEGGNKCVAFWWWCNNVFQGQKNGNNNLRAIHFKVIWIVYFGKKILMLRLHLQRTSTFQLEISCKENTGCPNKVGIG